MVALGIILLLLGVGLGTLLYLGSVDITDQITLSLLGTDVGFQPLALVMAGALVMLLLWLGLVCLRLAVRRKRKRDESARAAQARAAADKAEEVQQAAERGAAQRALAEQRGRSFGDPAAPGTSGATATLPPVKGPSESSEVPPPPPPRG